MAIIAHWHTNLKSATGLTLHIYDHGTAATINGAGDAMIVDAESPAETAKGFYRFNVEETWTDLVICNVQDGSGNTVYVGYMWPDDDHIRPGYPERRLRHLPGSVQELNLGAFDMTITSGQDAEVTYSRPA